MHKLCTRGQVDNSSLIYTESAKFALCHALKYTVAIKAHAGRLRTWRGRGGGRDVHNQLVSSMTHQVTVSCSQEECGVRVWVFLTSREARDPKRVVRRVATSPTPSANTDLVRFGQQFLRWTRFQVAVTPLHGTLPTYFSLAGLHTSTKSSALEWFAPLPQNLIAMWTPCTHRVRVRKC
jgi:hypothetical protein